MKNTDIKAMLDIASKIIEAAKAVLIEEPKKPKKKPTKKAGK